MINYLIFKYLVHCVLRTNCVVMLDLIFQRQNNTTSVLLGFVGLAQVLL
jgi:hypothetical protein